MVDVYDGILKEDSLLLAMKFHFHQVSFCPKECESFFKDLTVNRTMRRRFTGKGGDQVQTLGGRSSSSEEEVDLQEQSLKSSSL